MKNLEVLEIEIKNNEDYNLVCKQSILKYLVNLKLYKINLKKVLLYSRDFLNLITNSNILNLDEKN